MPTTKTTRKPSARKRSTKAKAVDAAFDPLPGDVAPQQQTPIELAAKLASLDLPKLQVSRSTLADAVSRVEKAVPARPSNPILGGILCVADADAGRLILTAYDSSTLLKTSIEVDIEQSFSTIIPSRLLGDVLNKALKRNSEIAIVYQSGDGDEAPGVTFYGLTTGGEFKVNCFSANDWPPALNDLDKPSAMLDTREFQSILSSTIFAVSSNQSKGVLTGVCMTLNDGGDHPNRLELAATDGHRLNVNLIQPVNEFDEAGHILGDRFVVPAGALKSIGKLIEGASTVSLGFSRAFLTVYAGDSIASIRLLDGEYPNYKLLVPTRFEKTFQADRKALIDAISEADVIASQNTVEVEGRRVTSAILRFLPEPDRITVKARADEYGNCEVTCPIEWGGELMQFACNGQFLVDALNQLPCESVLIQLNSPTALISIKQVCDESLDLTHHLVMPIQIRQD
ncbi:MAG: DNA polymerase III subunit beta [Cyanobacteria bacterium J06607_13]